MKTSAQVEADKVSEELLFPGHRARDMYWLVTSFHVLEDAPREFFSGAEFEPKKFARWAVRGGAGRCDAGLFCLSVWNRRTNWNLIAPGLAREKGGRFELHAAFANWDGRNREAFLAWCAAPWWA